MIRRIWRGWTEPSNADAYQRLLSNTIVPGIASRQIPGVKSIEILRRSVVESTEEVEFVTIMTFEDWAAVESFAGPDRTGAVVPDAARRLLKRFDQHSAHYEHLADY